ncbi:CDP-alcohol phosphatidyltransferase family protein [Paenibacillus sp. MBLB2552]|uniref:CDP-alcohol phosphatidyltransferase family protein n=1 Tax=Paenibacillus mellifer TaxID=2937794 RepID=A0A9X1XVW2_9BACL|nr:CDP-alcohol phosphatidyltransferase family protein [Paenibacillus mellifer]MCK8485938.1 CDP-alcohol phosphatidyltransferase family protein [Paenibacillus mellifer]
MKHLANGLTLSRMVLSCILLFTLNQPAVFIIIYTIAGITDVLDGSIARRTSTVSALGAKLDSMADLLMFGVATLAMARWAGEEMRIIWPYLAGAITIRLASAVYAACKFRTVAMIHTWGNKITGLLVFVTPWMMFMAGNHPWVLIGLGIVSAASAAEELLIHLTSKELDLNRRSWL